VKFSHMISVIDSHTAGCATRIVTSGFPIIPGRTMAAKKKYAEDHLTAIRKAILEEPRGHKDMVGAVLTAPTCDEADVGVLFIDPGMWENMSGHGAIGVASAMIETGMVSFAEPITRVVLDTPAGLVECKARIQNGVIESVTLRNVPSFLYKSAKILVPEIGEVKVDVAYGGDTYAIVGTDEIGTEITPRNASRLAEIGLKIKEEANREIDFIHPEKNHVRGIGGVRINTIPPPSRMHAKQVVIWSDGLVDRSPCGTGCSAALATSYAKGQIEIGEETTQESIIGTTFKAKIVKETKVGNLKAVIPEISGTAYITGLNTLLIDPRDPLKDGYLLTTT